MGGTSLPFCVKGSVICLPPNILGNLKVSGGGSIYRVMYVAKFEEAYGFCN